MLYGKEGFVIVDFNLVAKKLSQLFLLMKLWILEKKSKKFWKFAQLLKYIYGLGEK